MILYLSVIFISVVMICGFNIAFGLQSLQCAWWIVCVVGLCGVVFEVVIDAIFALLLSKTPDKWYTYDKKYFQVSRFERKFLEKLRIRKWKDKVWELGGLGGFSKKKLENPTDSQYIEKFLVESNKGIIIHIAGIIFGFLILFVFPWKFALSICLPIAFVNTFLNTLSIIVLRYNYPKLLVVHKKLSRNIENKESL